MPKHVTMATTIVIRLPTAMDGRDKYNRPTVACPVVGQGDEANLVPMVVSCVISKVTIERRAHHICTKDHHYYPGVHIVSRSTSFHSPPI